MKRRKKHEKRLTKRHVLNHKLRIFESDGNVYDEIVDISKGGCKLITCEKLNVGEYILISLFSLCKIGKVIRYFGDCEYGISFVDKND